MKTCVVFLILLAASALSGSEHVVFSDGMETALNMRKREHSKDQYTPEYARLLPSESKRIPGTEFQEGAKLLIHSFEQEYSLISTTISEDDVSDRKNPTPDEIARKAEKVAADIRLFRKFRYKTKTKQISVVPITALSEIPSSPHFISDFFIEFEMREGEIVWRMYLFFGEFLKYFEPPPDGLFDSNQPQAQQSQFVFHRFEELRDGHNKTEMVR